MGAENQAYRQSCGIFRYRPAWGVAAECQTSQNGSAESRFMSFLLDTTVVSEWVKTRPNRGVVAWLADIDEDRVFISVVTLAELRHGIERMGASSRRKRLDERSREEVPARFEGRVLSNDGTMYDCSAHEVA